MAFHQPYFLSDEQLISILSTFAPGASLSVAKVRYKNKQDIRKIEQMTVEALQAAALESMESGSGEDLEVYIPFLNRTLIGHHDGVFWLEPRD